MTQPTAAALLAKQGPFGPVTPTKDTLLQQWLDAKKALDDCSEKEMNLRKLVVAAFPFDADKKEGTQNLDLNNGWKLKVVLKQNYTLSSETDKGLTAYEESAATEAEKAVRKMITDRLVKWKPSLSIAEYRLLDDAARKAIEPVLTIKDGAPTLELIEPKVKA